MSNNDYKNRKFTVLFIIIGIVSYQFLAPQLFPNGGLMRSLVAGIVVAICALIGLIIDKKIDK